MSDLEQKVVDLESEIDDLRAQLDALTFFPPWAVKDKPPPDTSGNDENLEGGDFLDSGLGGTPGAPGTPGGSGHNGADGGDAYWFKGPLEMYDVNHSTLTVKFYGSAGLAGDGGYIARFKGIRKDIADGGAKLDYAEVISEPTWFYVKGAKNGSQPPFGIDYTFERSTSGFPTGDDDTEIFPCWYVNIINIDGTNYIDLASIERWLAEVNIPGIS